MGAGGHAEDRAAPLGERSAGAGLGPPESTSPHGQGGPVEPEGWPTVSVVAAGDLADDLARFTTLEACAAAHGLKDPLLADSLHALGYDAFAHDACRVLAAAKARDPRLCDPIDVSTLRERCRVVNAMVNGAPEACPFVSDLRPSLGRDPGCLAVASRDPRACADAIGDPLEPGGARATCEALARGSDEPCRAAPEPSRSACLRERARWKNVIEPSKESSPSTHILAGALRVTSPRPGPRGDEGDASLDTTTDVPLDVEQGVVVTFDPLRRPRVAFGARSGSGRQMALPSESLVEIDFAPRGAAAPGHAIYDGSVAALRLGSLGPAGDPLGQAVPVGCDVQVDAFEPRRGGRIALNFDSCSFEGSSYAKGPATGTKGAAWAAGPRVRGEIETFVRDVVDEPRAHLGP